jgi:hypothetical protein
MVKYRYRVSGLALLVLISVINMQFKFDSKYGVMSKISTSQDSKTTFKPTLTSIFLSRSEPNQSKTKQIQRPCIRLVGFKYDEPAEADAPFS